MIRNGYTASDGFRILCAWSRFSRSVVRSEGIYASSIHYARKNRQIPPKKNRQLTGVKETDGWIDTEEVDRIIAQSVGANKKQKTLPKKKVPEYYKSTSKPKKQEVQEEYLLVDELQRNLAWEDLKDLAQVL